MRCSARSVSAIPAAMNFQCAREGFNQKAPCPFPMSDSFGSRANRYSMDVRERSARGGRGAVMI
jgi:hypothetical protein